MVTAIIPPELEKVLDANPEIIGGAIRFVGTRIPVQALLDTVHSGGTIAEFLDGWPDVSREQAEAVILWEQNQARSVLGLDLAS